MGSLNLIESDQGASGIFGCETDFITVF